MNSALALDVNRLEFSFGDLTRRLPANTWQDSVLSADERGSGWLEGEAMLDELGFAHNLIPAHAGGHWGQMDKLMDLYRALYRRDPGLGLGYAGSTFIACCNIWAVGSAEQQQKTIQLLKNNRRLACSYYEADHGNDLAAVEFRAERQGDYLLLNGRKNLTTNIRRADAAVVFARISDDPGSRSHSQLLLFKDQLPKGAFQDLNRHASAGMRNIRLGGFEVEDLQLPASVILGIPGQALETTMRSFQVTRSLIPGMFLGALDTSLRLAMQFSRERCLHSKRLSEYANTRYQLTMTFLDCLLIDSLCRLGARALQVLPNFGCLYAPAIKVAVPHLLLGAMDRLSSLMGASFYRREGKFGLFQKLLRDTKPVGFAHVGRPACQLTLLPLLHLMARKTSAAEPLPSSLTDLSSDLELLDFARFGLSPSSTDPVLAQLDCPPSSLDFPLASLLQHNKELLLNNLRSLRPVDMVATAPKHRYELASTYASLLTAGSCLAWFGEGKGPIDEPMLNALVKRQLIHMNLLPRDSWSEREINNIYEGLCWSYENNISFDLMRYTLNAWENA
jgi:alkylation response protein AidB-like acyl-CoA dehydrogenase